MKNFLLTFYLSLLSFIAFSQYSVGFKIITFRDQSRFRNIITNIYYPATADSTNAPIINDGTKFPVVSFGHGFVMSSLAYQWLAQSLAASGYIVGFPATEDGAPNHAEFGKDELFVARILRNLGDTATSFLYQKTNGYTAIGGHSMGGGASYLAVNGAADITTLFNFSAAETWSLYGIIASDAAKNILCPSLVFSGTMDCVAPLAANSKLMYQNLKSEYKVFANIIGGSHCQFADANKTPCELGEGLACSNTYIPRTEQQNDVLSLLKPWLDFWLKRDCNAISTFYINAGINLSKIDTSQSKIIDCNALNTITTGIKQNKTLKAEIYPNPSNGLFTLSVNENYTNAILSIFDMSGKIIDTKTFKNNNVIELDYSYLAKGLYQLQFKSEKGNYFSKMVIE